MPAELLGTDDLIRDLLVADATLAGLVGTRIYPDQAVQGAAFPYVIFTFLSGEDTEVIGGFRVYTDPLYLVKAVTVDSNYTRAGQIFDRIDTVLQRASGTRAEHGIVVQSITRERTTRYPETPPQGTTIRHYGGQYRLFVSFT